MNYCELFSEHHLAMLSDWFEETGRVFVHLYIPHSGGDGFSHVMPSMVELQKLVSVQKSNEIELFIFRKPIENDDELDKKLESDWIYAHADEVLYLAVKKNRAYFEAYQRDPERYRETITRWRDQANYDRF
jgi:hypothetical protein